MQMIFVPTENARRSARNAGTGQKSTSIVRIRVVANLNHTENTKTERKNEHGKERI